MGEAEEECPWTQHSPWSSSDSCSLDLKVPWEASGLVGRLASGVGILKQDTGSRVGVYIVLSRLALRTGSEKGC